MYCRNCGKMIENNSAYCDACGTKVDNNANQNNTNDKYNFGFAVMGFFVPVFGFVYFLIFENKKPKRAKSAGKGALIGFITKTVLYVTLLVLYFIFTPSIIKNITDYVKNSTPSIKYNYTSLSKESNTDYLLEQYVDVSFGDFTVTDNEYYSETSLNVTVKNKDVDLHSYFITIEAVNADGMRLDTDMVLADKLRAGQEVQLTAFQYVEKDKIEQFKKADFRVLEITKM